MKIYLKGFWKTITEPKVSPLILVLLMSGMLLLADFTYYLGGWEEARKTPPCPLCGEQAHQGLCLADDVGGIRVFNVRDYTVDPGTNPHTKSPFASPGGTDKISRGTIRLPAYFLNHLFTIPCEHHGYFGAGSLRHGAKSRFSLPVRIP